MTSEAEFPADWAAVRRKDRAVTDDDWIRGVLRREPFGVLATVAEGQPFANSNIFAYDESAHAIYLHTARTGRTRSNVEAGDRACFTVSTMGRLLPASTALEMSVEYAGVIIFGRASVVADPAEARAALQAILDKYFPHLAPDRDYRAIQPEELARTTVYRLDVERWSGKMKEAPADFPGAFRYDERPGLTQHVAQSSPPVSP